MANENSANEHNNIQDKLSSGGEKRNQSEKELMVVGIGASAGGLEALESFFTNMPHKSGLSFVIVQHLSPDYKSLMSELLARYTRMQVMQISDGVQIKPDTVYLIPPKKNLSIFKDKLYLTGQDPIRGQNLPIDIFFRSLAKDKGRNCVGIILSGTGSDGTLGIRAVKEEGGIVMAQDDRSAKFDGMPRSSIATGLVDYVLSPDMMPRELIKFIKHPYINKTVKIENLISKDEDILNKIIHILRKQTGVDFSYYKPNTIIRRLEKRISINQIKKLDDYLSFLQQSEKEVKILGKELLIGVTQFFRDHEAFEELKHKVLPELLKNKQDKDMIRIWSVGCSTGEEAYSLAILVDEYLYEKGINKDIKVFATDIDSDSIELAGAGIYPPSIASDVTPDRLSRYFVFSDGRYQVNERIRRMIIFATHNVIKDPPFSKIDIVVCRNMLIYLQPKIQQKILSMFYYSMQNGSFMVLGSSETLGDMNDAFETVNSKWKIYRYKTGYKSSLPTGFMLSNLNRRKTSTQHGTFGKYNAHASEDGLFKIFENLLDQFISSGVIIDEHFQLVHVIKNVDKYIRVPAGKPSLNILKMVRNDLTVVLGSMLQKVLKEGKNLCLNDIGKRDGDRNTVNINLKYLKDENSNQSYIAILFTEKAPPEITDREEKPQPVKEDYSEHMQFLQNELQYTRENLQATIEELETSNEELQSTNEELVASNEELQSTNEELQSVNEELYTVNSEYQNKIEELTQANNDIDNLLKNTDVGILFLDKELNIRKFTPDIHEVFNLMNMDVGRPIQHISHNLHYESLVDDIESVLDTLKVVERELVGKDGQLYLLKILPYRTMENAIEGIVLTLIDITTHRNFEKQLLSEHQLLMTVLEHSPVGKVMLDKSGNFTYMNKAAEKMLRMERKKLEARRYNKLPFVMRNPDSSEMSEDQLPFRIVMNSQKPLRSYEQILEWEDGSRRSVLVHGAPTYDKTGTLNGAVFSLEDMPVKHSGKKSSTNDSIK